MKTIARRRKERIPVQKKIVSVTAVVLRRMVIHIVTIFLIILEEKREANFLHQSLANTSEHCTCMCIAIGTGEGRRGGVGC